MYAHLFNASKAFRANHGDYKYMLIISDNIRGEECDHEIGVDSKKEARELAKEHAAQPWNF